MQFNEENLFLKYTRTISKIELPRVSYLLVGHDRTRNATIIDRRNYMTTTLINLIFFNVNLTV